MTTWAKLLLKLLNAIVDVRSELTALTAEERGRIASALDDVTKAVTEAFYAFEHRRDHAWDIFREVGAPLRAFVDAAGARLENGSRLAAAHDELQHAFAHRRLPTSKSRELNIADAITVRPQAGADVVKTLSKAQIHMIVHHETSCLRGASDLFRTLAGEVREGE